MKAKPPAIAAKHDDPDDRTNQWPYGGHGKAEAPEAPAKSRRGVKIASHDAEDSDDEEIAHVGATKTGVAPSLGGRCHPGRSWRKP